VSIAGLMVVVLLAAILFAALRAPTDLWAALVFYLTIAVLVVAALGARYRHGTEGAWWFGFALFGWGNLLLGSGGRRGTNFTATRGILELLSLFTSRSILTDNYRDITTYTNAMMIINCISSLILALAGGMLVRHYYRRGRTRGRDWKAGEDL
jgi:hypothetical protein